MTASRLVLVLFAFTAACGSEPAAVASSPAPQRRPPECVSMPPLYLVDGEAVDREAFNALDPDRIDTIALFQNPSVDRFGPGAECGAIVVTTK